MGSHLRSVALTGATQTVRTAETIYRGFTLRETGGTEPAVVRIFDATSATGVLLDSVALEAGTSLSVTYPAGIWATTGVHVEITGTGVVEGSLRIE
ncbi:MAG: hypothetical protein K0Q93_2145 [Nocardioidaceae bacterium]|jgi:hypothetical protein|nr:hypothetical protein [Nocardioidaceae bacterium]